MRIRTRLFLGLVVAVAVGLYYFARIVEEDLRPRYLEAIEDSLVDTSTILAAFLVSGMEGAELDTASFRRVFEQVSRRPLHARIYALQKESVDLRVYVTDAKGTVVFDSDGGRDEGRDYSRWNDVYLTLQGKYGARSTRDDPGDQESSVLYVGAPLIVNGRIVGVLTVCKPTANSNFFLKLAKRKFLAAGLLAGLTIVLVGIAISAWVTHPIMKLTSYARDVRDGKRTHLPGLGHSEIGTLGEAFEEMKDALQGKEYVERYVQTLTHEIKGPLTGIRGAVELLQEEMPPEQRARFLGNVHADADRIQRIVDRLLLLSSLESRKDVRDVEEIELTRLIGDTIASLKPVAGARKLTFDTDFAGEVVMKGERFLVHHAIVNLLQNAVDFSPEGGKITVSCTSDSRQAVVAVSDEGPGVPGYARQRVFDRFYSLPRPGTGKKSSGLGLTFVREVADLHGGSIEIENLPGKGARAVLRLGLSPAAP